MKRSSTRLRKNGGRTTRNLLFGQFRRGGGCAFPHW
eukprot:UN05760